MTEFAQTTHDDMSAANFPALQHPLTMDTADSEPSGMLILVATDDGATLCTNNDGNTRLIRTIPYHLSTGRHDRAGLEGGCVLVYKLLRLLEREAMGHSCYDSVAVFADDHLYPEFRRMQRLERRNFLILKLDDEAWPIVRAS